MLSLLQKLSSGLQKTKSSLVEGIQRVVSKARGLDEEVLEGLEEQLLLSDMGWETVEQIMAQLRRRASASNAVTAEEILQILKQELNEQLRGVAHGPLHTESAKPYIISVVGVNGTGKTTTIGKLAHLFSTQERKVLVAAADTFRAAAVEQLDVWRHRAGVDIVHAQSGADPAAVAFDALKAAMSRQVDVLLIDTAGRLHTKGNLMAELTKVHKVLERQCAGAPHAVLLVIDAGTGQNGLIQAKEFTKAAPITGLVITKLDGTAKGGIVFSIVRQLGLPICYIGLGEKIDDLEPFEPQTFIEALFQ
ncbi:MAG: Signal recognition particle receptor FtsY [bacterium ADurb.Bin478]|nr:MAG: Signal recognition particle receptor FtsY [bacterium ADurb.Bin478]